MQKRSLCACWSHRTAKEFAQFEILPVIPHNKEGEVWRACEACDDKHPAISFCLTCQEAMCEDAARWHARQKATRDHHVVSLEDLKANPKLAAVPVICSDHNEQFRFFDEDCGHVVCGECITLEHNGHKCLSLAEAASNYRQEMEALSTKASTHAEEIKAAEVRLEGVSSDLEQVYEEQAAFIQGTFEEVRLIFFAFLSVVDISLACLL